MSDTYLWFIKCNYTMVWFCFVIDYWHDFCSHRESYVLKQKSLIFWVTTYHSRCDLLDSDTTSTSKTRSSFYFINRKKCFYSHLEMWGVEVLHLRISQSKNFKKHEYITVLHARVTFSKYQIALTITLSYYSYFSECHNRDNRLVLIFQ